MSVNSGPLSLNEDQQKVVLHEKGPLLVIAGAGTGKTRVITERISHLITQKGLKPAEILALTFTEKAALEMEERVDVALPLTTYDTWISTFHAFAERILRENSFYLGLDSTYQVMTEAETLYFLKGCLPLMDLEYFMPPNNPTKFLREILTHLNRLRDEDISPSHYAEFVERLSNDDSGSELLGKPKLVELARIYKLFSEAKLNQGVVDYADLIALTLQLWREQPQILTHYQKQFKEILVDEYQDTNFAQVQLIKLLVTEKHNLVVVADDDQSIFRWRGAAVYNVLDFEKHFSRSQVITLKKTYRSAQEILDSAYRLIQHNNPNRLEEKIGIDKRLVSQREIKGSLQYLRAGGEQAEAKMVVEEIEKLTAKEGYSFRDVAILVRANNHGDSFAQTLNLKGIPYQKSGVQRWFQSPVVKDLIAYFNVLQDLADNPSYYRIFTTPAWEISGEDTAKLLTFARNNNLYFSEALARMEEIVDISIESQLKFKSLTASISRHRGMPRENVGQVLYDYMEKSGFLNRLKQAQTQEELNQAEAVANLFEEISRFQTQNREALLPDFLEYLKLLSASGGSTSDLDPERNCVSILTLHAAKGLEFPVVFMVNLVTSRFPSLSRSDAFPLPEGLINEGLPSGDVHLEEERRLFYVGMTRAMEKLYFTSADFYGMGKRARKTSPFVIESLGSDLDKFSKRYQKEQTLFDNLPFSTENKDPRPDLNNEVIQNNKPEYISYSQLDTFLVCPLQYKYRHLIRIPTLRSSAASFGTALHESLRDFYQGLENGNKWGLPELIDFYQGHWSSQGYDSRKMEERQKREGEVALTEYYKSYHNPKNLPKYIEYPFKIKLENVVLKGTIDRIDELEDGSIEIIDYKSSKPLDEKELASDKQLSIYALAVSSPKFMNIPLPKIKLSIYNFQDHTKRTTSRSEKDMEKLEAFIQEKVEEIGQSDFAPKVSMLCKFCSYQMLCDAYQGSNI